MVRIFIAHSSKDEWLVSPIAQNLMQISVEPYLARLEDPTPYPLPQKLDVAINSSTAMFVFLTQNVANNKDTRDIVNWEISAAYAKKKPIYVFAEKGVDIPLMVNYITVYATYDPISQESLKEVIERVKKVASALKENEDKTKAASLFIMVVLGILLLGALSKD